VEKKKKNVVDYEKVMRWDTQVWKERGCFLYRKKKGLVVNGLGVGGYYKIINTDAIGKKKKKGSKRMRKE
jgi:hypothetical protein